MGLLQPLEFSISSSHLQKMDAPLESVFHPLPFSVYLFLMNLFAPIASSRWLYSRLQTIYFFSPSSRLSYPLPRWHLYLETSNTPQIQDIYICTHYFYPVTHPSIQFLCLHVQDDNLRRYFEISNLPHPLTWHITICSLPWRFHITFLCSLWSDLISTFLVQTCGLQRALSGLLCYAPGHQIDFPRHHCGSPMY